MKNASFYTMRNVKGTVKAIKVDGYEVDRANRLFVYRNGNAGTWFVVDETCGHSIADGETRKAALESAKRRMGKFKDFTKKKEYSRMCDVMLDLCNGEEIPANVYTTLVYKKVRR